ncbi:MAG: family 43 glycosylhydrolase, partial [Oscillospiraceae bacterium]|nr:family 43 glycosylhydrolase [Oscillospiraceae bacterium]
MKSIKKTIRIGIAAGAMICLGALAQTSVLDASAHNPIVQTSFTPDPAPVVFGDELWVFTGCDKEGSSYYTMTGWQAFSTKDMQNWTDHGMILKDTDFSWCNANDAWASQCIERNGKYYFYFTTTNKGGGGRAIGVGVADKPEGPYKDVLGKPLAGPNWDYIDPTVIIDDDGQAWLMFGNPKCYYVKLKEDMVTLDGQIQAFPMTTEAFGPGQKNGCGYGEGPWIYKHKDLYYLVYACFYGSDGGESQAYATAPTVTGPWKFGNQIQKQSNCFTTHGGIIDYKDHSYFFYHKNGLKGGGTFNRSASCEEFTFNPDGSIPMINFTEEGPKQLEALNPYQRIEAETMSWSSGIKTEKHDSGVSIGFIENGDYTKISGVDFGETGAAEFYASVGSAGDGGKVEVHLDKVDGPIVGTVTVEPTGGWNTFKTV